MNTAITYHVRCSTQNKRILDAARKTFGRAYVSDCQDGWITVIDAEDRYDEDLFAQHAAKLSEFSGHPALYLFIYDSGLLGVGCFESGKPVAIFHAQNGVPIKQQGNPKQLASHSSAQPAPSKFKTLLGPMPAKALVEFTRLKSLAAAMGIPSNRLLCDSSCFSPPDPNLAWLIEESDQMRQLYEDAKKFRLIE